MAVFTNKLTRIGVFYDGNYFLHVSNYYNYYHENRARISFKGLHNLIRQKTAELEGTEFRYCQIVDAHYFRGRLRAKEAEQRDLLLKERNFEDILLREGITTHYLPMGPDGEKGIDVWLSLEAFELAIYKHFDVVVLIAGDGDFLPLVRKLNTIGTRVMLLAWDFKFRDQNNVERETRTSQALIEEVTYPIMMSRLIDDRASAKEPIIKDLFLPGEAKIVDFEVNGNISETVGTIKALKDGYGFIAKKDSPDDLFFHYSSVINADFNELAVGDRVTFDLKETDRGPNAVNVRVVS
ncbi:NYN domain-containing protein [bacterium]|nr:MAG: NYN domain-containing protein [bacterium]